MAFEINELGGIADKIASSRGKLYIVRLTQKLPAHERTYEEAERTIRVKLAQDKLRAKEEELIALLRKSVKVEVDESALATVKIDMGDGGGPASAMADAGTTSPSNDAGTRGDAGR